MLLVAGLSLVNLKPMVWDPTSSYYLPTLQAVMVSYADFHRMPARRRQAINQGLREYLGIPEGIKIYLDNGAFYFLNRGGETPNKEYEEFVTQAKPDWWPIPQDFIPIPKMTREEQWKCFQQTMAVNRAYHQDGYIPVIHISQFLDEYLVAIQACEHLSAKPAIALGGIVPNLLRASKAMSHPKILGSLKHVRKAFTDKELHVFGIEGTSTLHLASLLGIDSVDSSGWRNRAARGIVQLPGSGDRIIANLGNWRGREPSEDEWQVLASCCCPACQQFGLEGLRAGGIVGFCNRATHNLWVLLEEAIEIQIRLYERHLDNSTYLPLIRQTLNWRIQEGL